jgi:hypothetical protein
MKFKFLDVLKYCFLKTLLSSYFFVWTKEFNSEGNQQMAGFNTLIGIASLIIIYLFILFTQKLGADISKNIFLLIGGLFIVNEGLHTISGIEYSIYTIIVNKKPWQVTYKLCDYAAILVSATLCFVLPVVIMHIRNKRIESL